MKCVNVGCCVQHQLAPTLQNSPSVSVRAGAGRGGKGPPSLQRRGVSSLKQQNSSADTHRRSLHWHCYILSVPAFHYVEAPMFVVQSSPSP